MQNKKTFTTKLLSIVFVSLILSIQLLTSCKKEKDSVTKQTVSGKVKNICTDLGATNTTVYAKILKNGFSQKDYSTVTDAQGNFSFSEIEIHSNTEYSYMLYTPTINGDAKIIGSNVEFDKSNYSTNFQLTIRPELYGFTLAAIDNTITTTNDTLIVECEQRIIKNNFPSISHKLKRKYLGNWPSFAETFTNLPMGKWHITVDKWLNNVHTTSQDSIYFNFEESKSYIAAW